MQNAIAKVGVPRDDGTGKVVLTHDDCIRGDDRLSMVEMPFAFCSSAGCKNSSCNDCFMDPAVNRVLRCVSCEKCRCSSCQKDTLMNPNSKSQTILLDAYERALLAGEDFLDDADIKRVCVK